jgi:Ca2+-transporting ATPase
VITLCLSLGTKRMAKRNVIVRKLSAVETLGCTTVICTDKTGTLTTGQMTVKSLFTFTKPSIHNNHNQQSIQLKKDTADFLERTVEGVSYDPLGRITGLSDDIHNQDHHQDKLKASPTLQIISVISSLCNQARLDYRDGQFLPVGEPTEAALKVFAEKLGAPGVTLAHPEDVIYPMERMSRVSDHWMKKFHLLSILEFSRDRKSMSVLVRPVTHPLTPNNPHTPPPPRVQNMLLVKGAAELVLERCSKIMLEDGSIVPITSEVRLSLEEQIHSVAGRPLRSLALAYKYGEHLGELNTITDSEMAKENSLLKDSSSYSSIESDLTLVGFVGIKDPARPEAGEAIRRCATAGIRVMMISGDSKETATAIAKEVKIFDFNKNNQMNENTNSPNTEATTTTEEEDNDAEIAKHVFTSKEFFSLPREEQLERLKTGNKVFCRTEPRDKQKLISMLMNDLKEVPAMTGDGVNDAPALQQAAIGISMGQTGTEVAKSASAMILADDNFSSIVEAVEEGRNIFANMQSFIFFLLSCNLGEVIAIFLATVMGLPEPLTPLHLLWVNLMTDGPPATALAFNPADPTAMQKPPRNRNEPLFNKNMIVRYLLTGGYVAFATIGSFVWWFTDKAVKLNQLRHWDKCATWKIFSHAADAPFLPERPCDIFSGLYLQRAQSMAITVLVAIEMLKALSAVSSEASLLTVPPWKNPWLLAGVAIPSLLHLSIMYVPMLNKLFGLSPLTMEEWKVRDNLSYVLFFSIN